MVKYLVFFSVFFFWFTSFCQIELKAYGKTDTYELITNAHAPNYIPYGSPGFKTEDCDNHVGFKKDHITQVFDP